MQQKPYQDYHSSQEMKTYVYDGNERPTVPKNWPSSLQHLLKRECWSRKIIKRSNMKHIKFVLETKIIPELLLSVHYHPSCFNKNHPDQHHLLPASLEDSSSKKIKNTTAQTLVARSA